MPARERILDAAAQVMRSHGLAHATTKEIARAAGLSEAMLYKVFGDKVELFLAVLDERLPTITVLHETVPDTVDPAGRRRLAEEILSFYLESFPIAASLFSDHELLGQYREGLLGRDSGPRAVLEGVQALFSAEQAQGKIAAGVRTDVIAELLVGACLHRAFLVSFSGQPATRDDVHHFATDIADALQPFLVPCVPRGIEESAPPITD